MSSSPEQDIASGRKSERIVSPQCDCFMAPRDGSLSPSTQPHRGSLCFTAYLLAAVGFWCREIVCPGLSGTQHGLSGILLSRNCSHDPAVYIDLLDDFDHRRSEGRLPASGARRTGPPLGPRVR